MGAFLLYCPVSSTSQNRQNYKSIAKQFLTKLVYIVFILILYFTI